MAVLIVGLIADQAFRANTFGLAAAATLVLGAVLLVIVGRLTAWESRAIAGLAGIFGVWLAVRGSPWLLWPDLFAGLALLGLATSRGSLLDVGSAELSARAIHAIAHISAGAVFIAQPIAAARQRFSALGPLARGLVIGTPIVAVLCVLLASADPVFASFFKLNVDAGQLLLDMFFVAIGGLAMAGLLRLAAAPPIERVDGPAWRLGATEALVVLALLDAVFTAFAIAQVLAASGAAADTLRAAGVTYSDYARSGFFQLLWAGGITLVVLILFSRITGLTRPEHKLAFLVLSEIAIALTLMTVVVAFRRLSLYEEAYGFTMLRLYSHIFAVWMALVFLLLGAEMAGLGRRRRWFVGATIASALIGLLALNFVNPEAVVVGLNVDHARATHTLDTSYFGELSTDATPAMLQATGEAQLTRQMLTAACRGPRSYSPALNAFNFSAQQAADARRAVCG